MNTQSIIPIWQQAIRDKCYHPSGAFIEFRKEDIEQSIPERFEQIVRENSERLAAKIGTEQITYGELNNASNKLAVAVLRFDGKGNGPIALLLDDSISMIVAILGILKAGKAFVPLNPSFPLSRIAYMIEDSRSKLILTDTKNLPLAHELTLDSASLLNIDEADSNLSEENPRLSISPDAVSNIVYTSGSTGQPKGVFQNHRNMLHFVMNRGNLFHICNKDRIFNPSVTGWNIFVPLLFGAGYCSVNVKREGIASINQWLSHEAITIFASNPRLFRSFTDTIQGGDEFPGVRLVRLLGEPVYSRDVQLYKENFSSDCIFVNIYGASELSPARMYFLDQQTDVADGIIPVGYPVRDTEAFVIDEEGRELGYNQAGEIVLKSQYLALGYWGKHDLTKASFLPDPKGGDKRIYRTGDRGSLRTDGCLVHLGRTDFQVKIRGYRVEVAEIESELTNLDGVHEAVVILQEFRSGDQRLLAYVVPAAQSAPPITTLRRALVKNLPDYMIPSSFVILDGLPRTPNGKVDRRALPEPSSVRPDLETPFVKPRTPIEEKLARIWSDILYFDEVGVHDNFLELGGHSLMASQVVGRVISTFQIEISVKALFESPTVAEMAIVITQNQAARADEKEVERMLAELEAISDEQANSIISIDL